MYLKRVPEVHAETEFINARGAIDSNSVGFFEVNVGAAYDFSDWFGVEAGVRMLRSSAIDETASNALLTIRWP